MRISFEAQYSLEDFEQAVKSALDVLRQNGVEQLLHVNLYLSLRRDRRGIDLIDETGTAIDHLIIDGPIGQIFRLPRKIVVAEMTDTRPNKIIRKAKRK